MLFAASSEAKKNTSSIPSLVVATIIIIIRWVLPTHPTMAKSIGDQHPKCIDMHC